MTNQTNTSTTKRTVSVLLAICIAVGFSGVAAGGALAAPGEDLDGETVELEDVDGEALDELDADTELVSCIVEVLTNPYKHTCYVG